MQLDALRQRPHAPTASPNLKAGARNVLSCSNTSPPRIYFPLRISSTDTMAEEPFYSSQGSVQYSQHAIIPEEQENIASSPPKSRSPRGVPSSALKPRGLPTVTPKRFRKFFAPRVSQNTRIGRQSRAGRQLRDITKNGANQRRLGPPA